MMRVCLDANVFISYLLNTGPDAPPRIVLEGFFQGLYELAISEETLEELVHKVKSKPYLSRRIAETDVKRLIDFLRRFPNVVKSTNTAIPRMTRDPKDDYLIAHALLERVDYLVSGDKDLLALGSVLDVRIVSTADFALLLRPLPGE